ncbi:hypothetical protein BG006_001484, partial [Podila minutissima]
MSSVSSGGNSGQNSRRFLTTKIKLGDSSSKARSFPPAAVLPNYKTEFCNKFQKSGSCPFGDRCQFVHEFHELQKRGRPLTYKTRVCWSGDNCRYQQNHGRCIYLHGDETANMFDQQRGISYARVQKILMNKEHCQQQQQKCEKMRQQDYGHQRHHSNESSGTDFSSRRTPTEPSLPLIRTMNRFSTLSNTSSWPSSWSSESSILCESPPTESCLTFNDHLDDLLDSLVEPTTRSASPLKTDQAPTTPFHPAGPDMDMGLLSMMWPLPHRASQEFYSILAIACMFSPLAPSPFVPNVDPASTGARNVYGGTGSRSIAVAHMTTYLPIPCSDHYPLSNLLLPEMMPDIDLPYMAQGQLHEWQDSCFEDDESFSLPAPGAFDHHQDLLSSADPVSPLAPLSIPIEIKDRASTQQQNAYKALEDTSPT